MGVIQTNPGRPRRTGRGDAPGWKSTIDNVLLELSTLSVNNKEKELIAEIAGRYFRHRYRGGVPMDFPVWLASYKVLTHTRGTNVLGMLKNLSGIEIKPSSPVFTDIHEISKTVLGSRQRGETDARKYFDVIVNNLFAEPINGMVNLTAVFVEVVSECGAAGLDENKALPAVAYATLLAASTYDNSLFRTQADVASTTGVSTATLRSRLRDVDKIVGVNDLAVRFSNKLATLSRGVT